MNKKILLRSVSISVLLLICISIGIYSYTHLAAKEEDAEINLFSLVPSHSIAVLETSNLNQLIQDINKTSFNKKIQEWHFSDLLNFLKNNIDELVKNTAHGLSSQMNQMLISFHQPGTIRDQVFYCKLGKGDATLIENMIKKSGHTVFPAKLFNYRNQNICIYPLKDNDFLACYFQPEFFVISYQKKLIEKVIDTYLDNKSLKEDSIFAQFIKEKKTYSPATLYIKSKHLSLGKKATETGYSLQMTHWTKFDIKLHRDAIYLSGSCLDTDTCHSFENTLLSQHPLEDFPGKYLPLRTCFFNQLAMSDFSTLFSYISTDMFSNNTACKIEKANPVSKNDSVLYDFFLKNGGKELCYMMFYDNDTSTVTRKMINIQLKESISAESEFKEKVVKTTGKNIFLLPSNTFFAQFTGNPAYNEDVYGYFYNGALLIAPKKPAIQSYINQMEKKKTLEQIPLYEECVSSLSTEYNCLFSVDMHNAMSYPENYERLLPNFFFNHTDFFKDFLLTAQFTCMDGKTYPYLVLIYKGEEY